VEEAVGQAAVLIYRAGATARDVKLPQAAFVSLILSSMCARRIKATYFVSTIPTRPSTLGGNTSTSFVPNLLVGSLSHANAQTKQMIPDRLAFFILVTVVQTLVLFTVHSTPVPPGLRGGCYEFTSST
jgi:hypothetical protein